MTAIEHITSEGKPNKPAGTVTAASNARDSKNAQTNHFINSLCTPVQRLQVFILPPFNHLQPQDPKLPFPVCQNKISQAILRPARNIRLGVFA
jgi:hypothetical protein